jgi:hypothetical protein
MRQTLEKLRGKSMKQRYTEQYRAGNLNGEWTHPFLN